jgi:hypothetical protein
MRTPSGKIQAGRRRSGGPRRRDAGRRGATWAKARFGTGQGLRSDLRLALSLQQCGPLLLGEAT